MRKSLKSPRVSWVSCLYFCMQPLTREQILALIHHDPREAIMHKRTLKVFNIRGCGAAGQSFIFATPFGDKAIFVEHLRCSRGWALLDSGYPEAGHPGLRSVTPSAYGCHRGFMVMQCPTPNNIEPIFCPKTACRTHGAGGKKNVAGGEQ